MSRVKVIFFDVDRAPVVREVDPDPTAVAVLLRGFPEEADLNTQDLYLVVGEDSAEPFNRMIEGFEVYGPCMIVRRNTDLNWIDVTPSDVDEYVPKKIDTEPRVVNHALRASLQVVLTREEVREIIRHLDTTNVEIPGDDTPWYSFIGTCYQVLERGKLPEHAFWFDEDQLHVLAVVAPEPLAGRFRDIYRGACALARKDPKPFSF